MRSKFVVLFLFGCALQYVIAQPSKNLTLLSSVQIHGQTTSGCWHYNDSTGKEYALIGASHGIDIIDITDPANPNNLFQLPGVQSIWHEVKVLGNYAYAVSQNGDTNGILNGLQIIDLRFLPDSAPYKFYQGDSIIANQLITVHSITADGHYVYLNGHNISFNLNRGVIILDVADPWNPKYAGAIINRYCHDSYVRGDIIYTSDIQNGLFSVYNIADPSNPVLLATQSTPGGYNHNTWLSDNGQFLFAADEVHNAPLAAYDISDLNNITLVDTFYNKYMPDFEVHNVRVKNDFLLNPSYGSQLTIVDAMYPGNLIEVGNYTTGTGLCWDADPFTASGNIITTDMDSGMVYIFGPNYVRACYLEGTVSDSITGLPIIGATIQILPANAAVISDVFGDYQSGVADSGQYTVFVSKSNYVDQQLSVSLYNGVLTHLNVKLLSFADDIDDLNKKTFTMYPNPARDFIRIESKVRMMNWTVIDANGKVVLAREKESGQFNESKINISSLSPGNYFISLQSDNESFRKPFVKN